MPRTKLPTVAPADAAALASYARQAITTKYLGPTDLRGARVVAKCDARKIIVSWDHALDAPANHAAAALALHRALGWHERNGLVMGGTKDGYVFVQISKSEER